MGERLKFLVIVGDIFNGKEASAEHALQSVGLGFKSPQDTGGLYYNHLK
jgi:hypothetical protein